jgi:hypothetical protein
MKNCIKSLHEVDSILYQKSIPFFEMILLDKLPLFQNDAGHYENQQDVF